MRRKRKTIPYGWCMRWVKGCTCKPGMVWIAHHHCPVKKEGS